MPIDTRFSIALAIMAVVAFGCRVAGLIVGTHLGDKPDLRRFLDILPACAMGAVLGPSLAVMTPVQAIAVSVSALVFLTSSRFLLALALGTAVLLSERWIMAMIARIVIPLPIEASSELSGMMFNVAGGLVGSKQLPVHGPKAMTQTDPETTGTIRFFDDADHAGVVALFTSINRELAPEDMRERFEAYIAASLAGELSRIGEVFSAAKRNAFWVVTAEDRIIGMFGLESRGPDTTELRRMYLDHAYRGRGIAQRMLACAESRARDLGFTTMLLSTAEIQRAALAFYRKHDYRLVRTERAEAMSTKTVGGGLTRFHFEKTL